MAAYGELHVYNLWEFLQLQLKVNEFNLHNLFNRSNTTCRFL